MNDTTIAPGAPVPGYAPEAADTAPPAGAPPPVSGDQEIDSVSTALADIGKGVVQDPNALPGIHQSLDQLSTASLEAAMFRAMLVIVKSKLDQFLANMRDSLNTMLEAKEMADMQADKIREQASAQLAGAIAGGTISIAGSATSIAGSMKAAKGATGADGGMDTAKFQATSQKWQGFSEAIKSAGSMADSGMRYSGSLSEAEGAMARSESDFLNSLSQTMRDAARSDEQFVQQALSTLKEMLDVQHQARSKVVG
ncbi:MAG: hypothetical protein OXC81_07210 [Betaproteobacteria bacterium]|nr:hypothetical protein [Betaproteobacteria bacterium]